MQERLLSRYNRCLEGCTKRGSNIITTGDHVVPLQVGIEHPTLKSVVSHAKNKIRHCWDHHAKLEIDKTRAYKESGITGLVTYIANEYPDADRMEAKLLRLEHLATILSIAARRLSLPNETTPEEFKEDYHMAASIALERSYSLRQRFEELGGFAAVGDFGVWELQRR